jgi:predicted O-linked N-acetylglucosamine transferase (SPINDLY family)
VTSKRSRDPEKRFERSVSEALEILERTKRLIRHVERAVRLNERAQKGNRKLIRAHPGEKRVLEERRKVLLLNGQSLRLQLLTVMNVEMSLVYSVDFALQLHDRSSGALKEIAKVQKQDRNVLVKTPQKHYKVLETLRRGIESAKKVASIYIT